MVFVQVFKTRTDCTKNTIYTQYPHLLCTAVPGGRITALHVALAALFRKTDWESGRGVLPCWKAESAPRATTKPIFPDEALGS